MQAVTAPARRPEDMPTSVLLDKLREVYDEKGVSIWLAHALKQGWSFEECLRRVDILITGAFA